MAFLGLLGLSPRKHSAAGSGRGAVAGKVLMRGLLVEGLEARQLMAADINFMNSPGTFVDNDTPLATPDTAVTNVSNAVFFVDVTGGNDLIVDTDNNGTADSLGNIGAPTYSVVGAANVPVIRVREVPAGTGLALIGLPIGVADDVVNITYDFVAPPTPGVPDLQAASDTGVSNLDNITSDNTPTFTIALPGYLVANDVGTKIELMEGTTVLASIVLLSGDIFPAGAVSLTSSTLADGSHSIFARATDLATNQSSSTPLTPVVIDTAGPTPVISSGASSPTNANPIPFLVSFGEPVTGLVGFTASDVASSNGSGVVLSAPGATDYPGTVVPTANGAVGLSIAAGMLTDVAGNPNIASNAFSIVSDTTGPSVVSIAITSATGAQNNFLNAGDIVTVTVTMNEATVVTGTPQLALNVGGITQQANYFGGTGTTSLTFTYTIVSGDTDVNGISVNANSLTLNGGTLQDAVGNNATLTHAAVADNASYKVDTTAPTVGFTRANPNPTNATSLSFNLNFNESVINVDVGDFSPVLTGTLSGAFLPVTGSGASYSLPLTVGGDGTFNLDLAGGNNITDPAGNAIVAAPSPDETYTIDQTKPVTDITNLTTGLAYGLPASATPWPNSIVGTALDPVIGGVNTAITAVNVSIRRASDGRYFNGTSFVVSGTELLNTASGTANWNYNFPAANFAGVSDTYTITSHATDAAGNVETTHIVNIVYDDSLPTVSLTSPGTTFDHTPTLGGSYADPIGPLDVLASGVASVTVALAGPTPVAASLATIGAAAGGAWSFTAPTLADGVYTVTVVATDFAGNSVTTTGSLTVFSLAVKIEATDTDGREDSPNPPSQTNGQWTASLVAFSGTTSIPIPSGTFPLPADLIVPFTLSTPSGASVATYGSLANGGDFTISLGTAGAVLGSGLPGGSQTLPISGAGVTFTMKADGTPTLINMTVSDDLVLDPGEAVLLTAGAPSNNADVGIGPMNSDRVDLIDNEASPGGILVSITATDAQAAETTVPFNIGSVLIDDIIFNQNATSSNVPDPTQVPFTAGGSLFSTNANALSLNDGLPNDGFFAAVPGVSPAIQLNYSDTDNGPNARVFSGAPSSVVIPHVAGQYEFIDIIGSAISNATNKVKLSLTIEYGNSSTVFTTPTLDLTDWNDDVMPANIYQLGNADMDAVNVAGTATVLDDPSIFGYRFDLKTLNPHFASNATKVTLNVDTQSSLAPNNRFALMGAFGTQSIGNMGEYEVRLTSGGSPATTGVPVTVRVNVTGTATPGNSLALPNDYQFFTPAGAPITYVPTSGSVAAYIDVVVPAGSSSVKFKFTTFDDMIVEPQETVIGTVGAATTTAALNPTIFSFLSASGTSATATIDDNDFALANIVATDNAASETATNNGEVTVSLSKKDTTYTGSITSSTDTYVPVAQSGTATTGAQVFGATSTFADYQTGVVEVEGNNTTGTAQRVDGYWNTNANPNIGNATSVPHNTVFGLGDGSTVDVYSFMVTSGQTMTFDIDSVTGAFDSFLEILAPNGTTVLATNDDSASDTGSPSTGNLDAAVSFTATATGLHFVRVSRVITKASPGPLALGAIPNGVTYQLHASITGHQQGALVLAGQSSTAWRVAVLDDAHIEGGPTAGTPETAIFTLGTPVVGNTGIMSSGTAATVNIADNDNSNTVAISGGTFGVENPQSNPSYTVGILNSSSVGTVSDSATTVSFKIVTPVPANFAEFGSTKDYTFVLGGAGTVTYDALTNIGTITIPAGTSSVLLTVFVNNDNIIEDDEDIQVQLIAPLTSDGDITISGTANTATVSIKSDEDSAVVTLNGGIPAIEGIQNGVLVVGLNNKVSDTDTIVRIRLTNISASASDYTLVQDPANPGTLAQDPVPVAGEYLVTIKAFTTSTTVFYNAPADGLIEPNETFGAQIVPISGSVNVGGDADIQISATNSATGTIVDNTAAYVKISKVGDVIEGNTQNFTIALFKDAALTIPFAGADISTAVTGAFTIGGTATPGLVTQLGRDYNLITPTTFSIPSGSASTVIPVVTFNEVPAVADSGETVIATLTSATVSGGDPGRIQLSTMATDTMIIIDNDTVTATVTTANADDAMMQERNNNGKVTINLSGAVSTQVTVELTIAHSSTATGNGSGASGDDFSISTYFVTFQPFETSKTVDLLVIDDGALEGAEFVDVAIKNIFAIDPQVSVPAPNFNLPGLTFSTPVRWNAVDGGNDHWYVQVTSTGTFNAQRLAALASTFDSNGLANANATLATITSSAENQFILNSVYGGGSSYIGAINNSASPLPVYTGTPGPARVGGGAGGLHRWVTNENWTFGAFGGSGPWFNASQPDNAGGVENVVELLGTSPANVGWNDADGTASKRAIFEFAGPNGGMLPLGSAVRVTIKADPQVQVVTQDNMAAETASALPLDKGVFRIQLRQDEASVTNTVANNVTVQYILRGEAGESSDYAALGLGALRSAVIPAGQSFIDIDISALNDALIENNEKVWIQLVGVTATGTDADLTLESNLYSMDSNGNLNLINPANGSSIVSSISITGVGTVAGGHGLAVNPLTGELFGLVTIAGNQQLIKITSISATSASATAVGGTTGVSGLVDIAFGNDGTLYGALNDGSANPDKIYTISLTTGAATFFNNLTTVAGNGEAIALGDPASNNPLFRIAGNPAEQFRTYNPAINANGTATGMASATAQGQASALTWNYAGNSLFFADSTENNDGVTTPSTVSTEFFGLTTAGAVTLLGNMNHTAEGLAYFHQMIEIKDNDLGILKAVATDNQGDDGYGAIANDDASFEIRLVDPVTGVLVQADTNTTVTFSLLGSATPYLGDQVKSPSVTTFATPVNLDTFGVTPQGGAYNWSLLTNAKIVNSTQLPHTTVNASTNAVSFDWYSFTVLNNGDRVIVDIDGTDFDSFVQITDLAGVQIGALGNNDGGSDAADGQASDSFIDTTSLAAGTYLIKVSQGPTGATGIPANRKYTLNLSVQNHLFADYQLTSGAVNNLTYLGGSNWSAIIPTNSSVIPLSVVVFNDTQVEGNESVNIKILSDVGDADIHLGGSAQSISPTGTNLQMISTGSGQVMASIPITLSPPVMGAFGHALAKHPTTGVLYAAIRLPSLNSDGLYTVDATTGVATLIGVLGDSFDALAFDNAGNLLGITEFNTGSLPNSLFRINTTNASKTVVGSVAPFAFVRHALALNVDNGLLYHLWGGTSANNTLFLQTINPVSGAIVTIPLTGAASLSGNPTSLAYEGGGVFKLIDSASGLWTITLGTGVANLAPVTSGAASSEGMVILQMMMTDASATIRDNDQAELYVVRTDNGAEAAPVDNGSITFGLRDPLTGTPVTSSLPVSFNYSIGGSATNGSDYGLLSGTGTIGSGMSELTVDVLVNNDSIAEGPEQADFTILTGPVPAVPALPTRVSFAPLASRTGTVFITEADTNVVQVNSTSDSSAAEAGQDPARFTFTMSGAGASVPVTVNFMVDTSTASPRASAVPTAVNTVADYTLSSPTPGATLTFNPVTGLGSIVFQAGFTAVNVIVTPNDDAVTEGTESLGLKIVSVSSTPSGLVGVGAGNAAAVTITDNDTTVVSIARVNDAGEDPSGTPPGDAVTGRFEVKLTRAAENLVSVGIMFNDPSSSADIGLPGFGPGPADFWSPQITNFGALTGTISFNPGTTSQLIDIIPLEQALNPEGNENVRFDLTGLIASTGPVSIAATPNNSASLLILDEFFDVFIQVDDSFASENGSLPTDAGSFNIRISSPTTVDTIVEYVIETTGTTNPLARVGQPTINEVEPNQASAAPFYNVNQNLDINAAGQSFGWSLISDSEVLNSGITGSVAGTPYVRVNATGNGSFDYYSFTATAGSRVILDVDRTNGSTDTAIFLMDSTGALLASNDNSASLDAGSTTLNDSFIDFTVATTGTYIIAVGENGSFHVGAGTGIAGNPLDIGDAYTLNVSVAGHLTADYATPLGTTGPSFNVGRVTIPAGSTFVPVNINPVDDKLIEGNETFRVRLIPATAIVSGNGATSVGATGPVVGEITIQDDDAGVVGAVAPSGPAVEPTSPPVSQNVDITIPFPSTQPVVVRFTVTGTATNPVDSFSTADYDLSSTATFTTDLSTTGATEKNDFLITIPAGQTKATVTITPFYNAMLDRGDNLLEVQETVVITPTAIVSGSQGGLITASNTGVTTLIDDRDVGRIINVSLGADLSGAEPGGAVPADISFLVQLSPQAPSFLGLTADGDITVNWSITGGDAIAAPAANADYQVLPVAGQVTVNANGTSGTVTIKAGTTGTFIPVLVLNDTIVETLESLTLTIATPVAAGGRNATLGTTVTQTATIADDPDTAVVRISALTAAAKEAGPVNGVFRVSQVDPSTGNPVLSSSPTKIQINLSNGGLNSGIASATDPDGSGPFGKDFDVTTNANVVRISDILYEITIPVGSSSTDVTIVPVNDTHVEALLETLTATLGAIQPGTDINVAPAGAPDNSAVVTIEDNDVAKFSFVNMTPSSTENNPAAPGTGDGNMRFQVQLNSVIDVPVTLVVTFSGGTALGAPTNGGAALNVSGGSTSNPNDYNNTVQTLTFAAGATGVNATNLDVALYNDGTTEASETFDAKITIDGASLVALAGRPVDLSMDTATATITDNDSSKITVSSPTVTEGGNLTFSVSLDKPADKDLTITVALQDGTGVSGAFGTDLDAVGPIPFGADYDSNDFGTTTVTFLAGTTSAGVSLPNVKTNQDLLVEGGATNNPGSETFTAVPTVVGGLMGRTITFENGTGTITDNDNATISISSTDAFASEPAKLPAFGNANFVVTMNNPSSTATVIPFTMSGDAKTGTQNPGAYSPGDYNLVLDAASIADGVTLTFNTATGTGTITIPASGTSLTGPNVKSATILLVPIDDDSTVGAGNGLVEDDETAIMTIGTPTTRDPNVGLGSPLAQTVTIVDDDDAVVSISTTQAIAIEGGISAVVRATLSNPVDEDMVVTIVRDSGSATPDDYAPLTFPTTITIPAGALFATLTVTAVNDTAAEGDETLNLRASAVSNNADVSVSPTQNTANLILRDNGDGLFVSIDVAASDFIAREQGSENGFFVIQLTDGLGNRVTVPVGSSVNVIYTLAASTALGADYGGPVSNNVTIPAGQSSAVFTITPVDDLIQEGTEYVDLLIQSGTGSGALGAIALGTAATPALSINNRVDIIDNDISAKVQSVSINNGAAQRSAIKRMTVVFDSPVVAPSAAFVVRKRDDNAGGAVYAGTVGGVTASAPDYASQPGKTVVTLTFVPSSTFVNSAGSLVDGNYELEITSSLVTTLTGAFPLDGDGNGTGGDNYMFGNKDANTAANEKFYRLYGDADGDEDFDGIDLVNFVLPNFGTTSASPGFLDYLDGDLDGDIDGLDIANQLLPRFGMARNKTGYPN